MKVVVAEEEVVETEADAVTVDSDAIVTEALAAIEAEETETADLAEIAMVAVLVATVTETDLAVVATAVLMFTLQHREAAAQVSLRNHLVQLNINF